MSALSVAPVQPWHVEVLHIALALCGCNAVPPDGDRTHSMVSHRPNPKIAIYMNVENALLLAQLRHRRSIMQIRRAVTLVAAACAALTIAENFQRIAGAKRILPEWYKTRPKQHQHAVQAACVSNEQRPRIDAAIVPRAARPVGRNGVLVAREACRAQYTVRREACRAQYTVRKAALRPRKNTPIRIRSARTGIEAAAKPSRTHCTPVHCY